MKGIAPDSAQLYCAECIRDEADAADDDVENDAVDDEGAGAEQADAAE
jgi:hypothetical protein